MILYRTGGPWGAGIGANLTAAQVDGNFYDVSTRVQHLELNPLTPIQIASFSAAGNQLYIHMSDGTVQGPLLLPVVRWFFRGNWLPSTNYSVDDVVVAPDSATYVVNYGHISGTSFDANANDGQGHQFYQLLLKVPAATIPAGGPPTYVLTKNTANNYDVIWAPAPAPPGGNPGDFLQKNSEVDGDASWNTMLISDIGDVDFNYPQRYPEPGDYLRYGRTGNWISDPGDLHKVLSASSWAPVVGDDNAFMVITNGTAFTSITIPRDDEQDFPVGTELTIHQDGTGTVRIFAEYGVLLYWHQSFSNTLLGQYATATVKKTAPYEWRLFGLLAGA